MCEEFEAGGLKMIDVRSFLTALKVNSLKRILTDEGKITIIFLIMCPLIQDVKRLGCEIVNVIINRVRISFWTDVMKHFKNLYNLCIPKAFNYFILECLYYNINIIM